MKIVTRKRLLPLLLLLAMLLTACGAGEPAAQSTPEVTAEPAPQDTETPEPSEAPEELPEGAVAVSTVDELLAAIAPNTTIVLRAGEYDLCSAADYGTEDLEGWYSWLLVPGGCTLQIREVDGLQLLGQGEVSVLAEPRYAEVLSFLDCRDLRLEGLTLGHTREPAVCAAGVLSCSDCDDVTVDACRLFGCGSVGLTASNCRRITLQNCRIDGCSSGALEAYGSRDLRVLNCELCDNGQNKEAPGYNLLSADRCRDLVLVNCEIRSNRVQCILRSSWSERTSMLGCKVEDNRVLDSVFRFEGRAALVEGCSFQLRSQERFYPGGSSLFAQSPEGEDLISFDLDHMEWSEASYEGPAAEDDRPARTELPDGGSEVHVDTVDDFLAAIAPDTTIYLDPGIYALSSALDYGGSGSGWYTWEEVYDGFCLTVQHVPGLRILGAGRDNTVLTVDPRYASVFRFRDCEDLVLSDFTAGHSDAPGYCTGNVLDFDSCSDVHVSGCGLFGCGAIGVWAANCEVLEVLDTEIYECSYAGAEISNCRNVSFEGCSIRGCDNGRDYILIESCRLTWNGERLTEGIHAFDGEKYLGVADTAW